MTKRTRTVNWEDPIATARAAAGLSGIEYLHQIISGELPPPPFGVLLDFRVAEISEGHAVFLVTPAEFSGGKLNNTNGESWSRKQRRGSSPTVMEGSGPL
ncbi:MAG TPA: hypothetical protein VGO68_05715 [Pyrinomonadaceae bacterium]|jgi:hypothetical protein|nr:hypothetical protein [Pyrinomonadaceae bacterium]